MAIQLAPVGAREQSIGADISARSAALGERASPVVVLDHFRISAPVFGPHAHAGFSCLRVGKGPPTARVWVTASSPGRGGRREVCEIGGRGTGSKAPIGLSATRRCDAAVLRATIRVAGRCNHRRTTTGTAGTWISDAAFARP